MVNEGIFFIDRKFSFYKIENYDQLIPIFAQDGKITLIDGELTLNVKKSRPYFLVFDILMVNGEYHGNKNLKERLEVIGKVITEFRGHIDLNIVPFEIIGKKFWKKEDIKFLTSCIKEDSKGEHFFDDNDKRCHKTDGIIFTPVNESYTLKTCSTLLKWKYLDLMTVDFRLVPNTEEGTISFYLMGPNNEEIETFRQKIFHQDLEKLRRDWTTLGDKNPIAECFYDKWIGFWRYKLMRIDKAHPNYIRILIETLEVLAEAINIDEIKHRIPKKPNEDDFYHRVQTSKHHSRNHRKPDGENNNNNQDQHENNDQTPSDQS